MSCFLFGASGQDLVDDSGALNTGQALVQALVAIGKSFVVDAQALQHRGVEVVDVHRIADDVIAEIIGFSEGDAFFDSAACHPHAKVTGMVIPSIVLPCEFSLTVDRSPEFTTKDHQRVLEKSSGF